MSNGQNAGRGLHRPSGAKPDKTAKLRAADASMTLLNAVVNNPIDPGYAASARQRESGEPHRVSMLSRAMVIVLAVLLGLATSVAVVELRRPAPEIASRRASLEREITSRTKHADELEAANIVTQGEIDAMQEDLLGTGAPNGYDRVSLAAGSLAVRGPGIAIELSDAEPDVDGAVEQAGIVRDLDLQLIVNGLWASGAEAIAINNRRLTSVSAIRNAGQAVLVDLQPILQPYVIKAIGNSDKLQTQLARTSTGPYLQALQDNHHIKVEVKSEKSLTLDASSTVNLQYATTPQETRTPSAPTVNQTAPQG